MIEHDTRPDCRVPIGARHKEGCDVEQCPHCGGQALGCVGFDPNDPRREVWGGKWPGEADCERLGFSVNGDRDFPDLNRLFAECVWNAEAQRWETRLHWGGDSKCVSLARVWRRCWGPVA
jgi:hypothetical protein